MSIDKRLEHGMAQLVPKATRLSEADAARVDRLVNDPLAVNLPEFKAAGETSESSVIRVAVHRGLATMEAELLAMKGSYTTEAELERTPASAG